MIIWDPLTRCGLVMAFASDWQNANLASKS